MGSGVLPLAMTTRSSKQRSGIRCQMADGRWHLGLIFERVFEVARCAEPIVQRDLASDICLLPSESVCRCVRWDF